MVLGGETGQEATTVEDGWTEHCCWSALSSNWKNRHIWSAGQVRSYQLQGGGVIIAWGVATKKKSVLHLQSTVNFYSSFRKLRCYSKQLRGSLWDPKVLLFTWCDSQVLMSGKAAPLVQELQAWYVNGFVLASKNFQTGPEVFRKHCRRSTRLRKGSSKRTDVLLCTVVGKLALRKRRTRGRPHI